jgi:hypothetical protein
MFFDIAKIFALCQKISRSLVVPTDQLSLFTDELAQFNIGDLLVSCAWENKSHIAKEFPDALLALLSRQFDRQRTWNFFQRFAFHSIDFTKISLGSWNTLLGHMKKAGCVNYEVQKKVKN